MGACEGLETKTSVSPIPPPPPSKAIACAFERDHYVTYEIQQSDRTLQSRSPNAKIFD